MPNYFVCTYGNFNGREGIIKESLEKNLYQLHIGAKYPYAIDKIKSGDIILLKDNCYIIAFGEAIAAKEYIENDEWNHIVRVKAWYKLEEPVHSYGISWETLCGGSMSPVKQVTPEWAKEKMQTYFMEKENEFPVCIYDITLKDLLEKNLCVPAYQRGYCWRIRNVRDLLDDILVWQEKVKGCENSDLVYHLGTVILRKNDGEYEIIDGQQRLTTLAIWQFLKQKDNLIYLLEKAVGENNQTHAVVQAILRARNTIQTYHEEIDFSKIMLSVVVVAENQKEDLAYSFFSNSNTTGKRLSDYDLLKTHHLRYVQQESSAIDHVEKWHCLEKEGKMDELLQQMLFRLRNWRAGIAFQLNAADTPEHYVFHHFAVSHELLEEFPINSVQQSRFDSILSGGDEFFDYTEYYRKKLKVFCEQDVMKRESFLKLKNHSNGILYAGIRAISFLFFCKFGDRLLSEAVYILAWHISRLRNWLQIRREYLAGEIFQQCTSCLDRVTSEREFFAILLDFHQNYSCDNRGRCATDYWKALFAFLKEAEDCGKLVFARKYFKSSFFNITEGEAK